MVSNNRCETRDQFIKAVVSIRCIAVLGFQPARCSGGRALLWQFPSAVSRYLVSNVVASVWEGSQVDSFPSAVSRYLVSNPTRKTPPLTSGGGNGLHTPRRIDHIPTFASLNHDKNTRSTHYTPNAGIELSETTPPPLRVNPVQNHT